MCFRLNRCHVTRTIFINLLREFVLKQERVGDLRFGAREVIDKLIIDELTSRRSSGSQAIPSSPRSPYDLVGSVDLQLALLLIVLDDDEMCMDSDGFVKSLLHHNEGSMRCKVLSFVAGRWSRQNESVSDRETWIVSCLFKMALETESDAACLEAVCPHSGLCRKLNRSSSFPRFIKHWQFSVIRSQLFWLT